MIPSKLQFMPAQSPDTLAALRADIAEHGVQTPVVIDQHGRIVDGNNRVAIANELGIDYPTEQVHVAGDDDAEDRAIALNLKRRSITQAQMRDLIADQIARHPEMSDRSIAKRLGCSHPTVASVRRGGKSFQPDEASTAEAAQRARTIVATMAELENYLSAIIYFLASNGVDLMRVLRALQQGETAIQGIRPDESSVMFWNAAATHLFGRLRSMVLDEGFQRETSRQAEGPELLPLSESDACRLLAVLEDPRAEGKSA